MLSHSHNAGCSKRKHGTKQMTKLALKFAKIIGYSSPKKIANLIYDCREGSNNAFCPTNTDEVFALAEQWLESFESYIGMTLCTSSPRCCVILFKDGADIQGCGDSLQIAIMQAIVNAIKELNK